MASPFRCWGFGGGPQHIDTLTEAMTRAHHLKRIEPDGRDLRHLQVVQDDRAVKNSTQAHHCESSPTTNMKS